MGSVRWCRRFVFPFRSTLLHLVWQPFTGQDYVTSFLHTDCSVPGSEFDLSIDYLRFSPLFIVPKEIQFSKFIIAHIYILLFRSHSANRESDFLKNRFKVVKFLKIRKVFHLFNFVALPPSLPPFSDYRMTRNKKGRQISNFSTVVSLDMRQQAETFIPSARESRRVVATRRVNSLASFTFTSRANVNLNRPIFQLHKCWTSCSDGVINTDYIFPWATSEIISSSPDCHHMRVRLKSY